MHGTDSGDRLWMTFGMGFWLIVTRVVVYLAVLFAMRHGSGNDR